MHIFNNLSKNNLHHAYLIEGKKEEIIPEILEFLEKIGVTVKNNQDFNQIILDSFKIDDARDLKAQSILKGVSKNKKVFIIAVNNFLIEAQNTLLKMFEEPTDNTIFFIIIPDTAILLPTLLSRFYLIKSENKLEEDQKIAEEFLGMSLNRRIDFLKELVKKPDEEEKDDFREIMIDSTRSKAIKFLNALELILYRKLHTEVKPSHEKLDYFNQIFKAREFINQPGSSVKSLMESVALSIP